MASLEMSSFEEALLKAISSPSVVSALAKELESFVELCVNERIEKTEKSFDSKLKEQAKEKDREIFSLKKEINSIKNDMEDLKSYSYREDLILKGVEIHQTYAEKSNPEMTAETSVTDQVLSFFKENLDLTVPKEAVSTAHILPSKPNMMLGPQRRKPLPKTIVRFANRDWRNKIYSSRFSLRGKNVFIEEHLTSHTQELLAKARELKRDKRVYNCFSRNCKAYIRLSPSGRAVQISSVDELLARVSQME